MNSNIIEEYDNAVYKQFKEKLAQRNERLVSKSKDVDSRKKGNPSFIEESPCVGEYDEAVCKQFEEKLAQWNERLVS